MKKISFIISSFVFIQLNIFCADSIYPPKAALIKPCWLKVWAKDFFKLQAKVFSVDTVKVLAFTLPAYIGTRQLDENLQCCFYRDCCHKNVYQAHKAFYEFTDKGVPAMIGILSSFSFFSNNQDLRLTSFVYTEAVISYWILKNIFKNSCNCDLNKRPKNANFCKDQVYYGGFPSGHVGEVALAAVLFGLRHGPKWGVPLGVFAAAVFAASINGNRHYLSQVIGGLGLGLIYGLAANALIESKISCAVDFCFTSGANGYNGIKVGYSF